MSITNDISEIRTSNPLTNNGKELNSGALLSTAAEAVLSQSEFIDRSPRTVGVEAEFLLVDQNLDPIDETLRDQIIDTANQLALKNDIAWSFQSEMGAAQIEANQLESALLTVGEFDLEYIVDLFNWLDTCLANAVRLHKVNVLNLGLHPFASLKDVNRSSKEKYQQVPNHHIQNRIKEAVNLAEELDIHTEPDATCVGLSQALQFNISAETTEEGVKMVNWMLQMSAPITAITGNAGFIEGLDTGWNDARTRLWDQTHLTESGTRVGLPDTGFFKDAEDIFLHRANFPLILDPPDAAIAHAMSTSMDWLHGRLKFLFQEDTLGLSKILVEFRPMSIQQSSKENAATVMLSVGRLLWAMQNDESLLDFTDVRANTDEASEHGLDGQFVVQELVDGRWEPKTISGPKMREIEIQKAIQGIHSAWGDQLTQGEIRAFFQTNLPQTEPTAWLRKALEAEEGIENRTIKRDVFLKLVSRLGILK